MAEESRPPKRISTSERLWGLKWIARLVILVLVTWGIYHAVQRARHDLQIQQDAWEADWKELERRERDLGEGLDGPRRALWEEDRQRLISERFDWWRISPAWIFAAGVLYVLGGVPCWLFWHQTLKALQQRPSPWGSLRAYWIGHLGKYVPGKALVVVLRAGLIRGPYVDGGIAAIAVFVETLTMMAVGATWSAILLYVSLDSDQQRTWLPWAILLAVCAGLPTLPPIFRWLVSFIQRRRGIEVSRELIAGIQTRRMAQGWVWMSLSWALMGLSLWATLRAFPGDSRTMVESLADLPAIVACAALAVVLGFVSLLPGGVGVRELVVVTLLTPLPNTGSAKALAAALVVRVVWLLAEVLVSTILYTAPLLRRSR